MIRDVAMQGDIASQADVESFINQLPELVKGLYWYSYESDILQFLIMCIYSGIYFDSDICTLKTLDENFVNILGYESRRTLHAINGSGMNFEPHHKFPKRALQWIILHCNVKSS